jgi:putative chitinase
VIYRVRSAATASVIAGVCMLGVTGCLGDAKKVASTTTVRLVPTVAPTVATTADIATTTTAAAQTYTVVAGDSIGKIATKLGVSAQSIIDANGLTDPNKIQVGQKLRIPAGGASPTTTVPGGVAATTTTAPGTNGVKPITSTTKA